MDKLRQDIIAEQIEKAQARADEMRRDAAVLTEDLKRLMVVGDYRKLRMLDQDIARSKAAAAVYDDIVANLTKML